MNKKIILSFTFIFAVIYQLIVIFPIIYNEEDILNNGSEFKFRIRNSRLPVLCGKNYISLDLKTEIKSYEKFYMIDNIFVCVKQNSDGFAHVSSISKDKPIEVKDYVDVKYVRSDYKSHIVSFMLPFNRFYFKEIYADEIKNIYKKSIKDSSKKIYALVSIKNGKGLVKDLFIDDVSIMDMIEK
jgi:hypothetical protein